MSKITEKQQEQTARAYRLLAAELSTGQQPSVGNWELTVVLGLGFYCLAVACHLLFDSWNLPEGLIPRQFPSD